MEVLRTVEDLKRKAHETAGMVALAALALEGALERLATPESVGLDHAEAAALVDVLTGARHDLERLATADLGGDR